MHAHGRGRHAGAVPRNTVIRGGISVRLTWLGHSCFLFELLSGSIDHLDDLVALLLLDISLDLIHTNHSPPFQYIMDRLYYYVQYSIDKLLPTDLLQLISQKLLDMHDSSLFLPICWHCESNQRKNQNNAMQTNQKPGIFTKCPGVESIIKESIIPNNCNRFYTTFCC